MYDVYIRFIDGTSIRFRGARVRHQRGASLPGGEAQAQAVSLQEPQRPPDADLPSAGPGSRHNIDSCGGSIPRRP